MAESGQISAKAIKRTYAYFDMQDPEVKKEILDKYLEQRGRTGQAGVEFKNIDNKIKEQEQYKQNYKKFLENNTIECKITEIKIKLKNLLDDVCEEKIEYDNLRALVQLH
jgi:hypothetical protein